MDRHEFVQAFRLQNFMGFEDTGWIEFRPITLLFGRNSTGKSALMRALLLLRQSTLFPATDGPFSYVVDGEYDFGGYSVLVHNHDIERPIVIWFRCAIPQAPPADLLVTAPPSENTRAGDLLARWIEGSPIADGQPYQVVIRIRLEFRLSPTDKRTTLHSVDLIASNGDVIFQAIAPDSAISNGTWKVDSQFFDPELHSQHSGLLPEEAVSVWKDIVIFTGEGFLPRLRILDETVQAIGGEGGFDVDTQTIYVVLERIRLEIGSFLARISHLGPIRAAPQRLYQVSGRSISPSSSGTETTRQLAATRETDLSSYDRILNWMYKSALRAKPDLLKISEEHGLYELVFIESQDKSSTPKNALEVGSGLTQVLPVVVNALLASSEGVITLEQPELHLHPRAQAELADLFISVAQTGTRFFIETHSEHLLLRLQKYIAKTSAGSLSHDELERMLLPSQLSVYFINRRDTYSTVSQIEIGIYGDLLNTPDGFEEFFSDDLIETAERMRARLSGFHKEY